MSDFSAQLKEKIVQIEEILRRYAPAEEGHQVSVIRAMNYSLFAGGKRLRPMLMAETYRLLGGEGQVIEPFMAAIEMIHTYSLIHDDLPAMDDDELRRGKPTNHVVFGEDIAILAGDGLLNFAYETAAKAFFVRPGDPGVERAFSLLLSYAGIYGMVGGQTVDVETDNTGEISRDKLDFIYALKTGALLKASMHIPAVLAGATEEEEQILLAVAERIGLAFQIQDDILDITSTTEVLGKPTGSDEKNAKATYVTYEGLEKSAADVARLTEEAVEELHRLPGRNEFLEELLLSLVNRLK